MTTITIPLSRRWLAVIAAVILVLAGLGIVSGCAKFTEPFRDAPTLGHLSGGAVVGEMPDGFSNWAMKCDGRGHRVYTTYHGDRAYGAITAIPDRACGPDIP